MCDRPAGRKRLSITNILGERTTAEILLYPEGVGFHSPGSRSAPWEEAVQRTPEIRPIPRICTPKGLHRRCRHVLSNPFGVENTGGGTLSFPGCAARPWAVESNPFG